MDTENNRLSNDELRAKLHSYRTKDKIRKALISINVAITVLGILFAFVMQEEYDEGSIGIVVAVIGAVFIFLFTFVFKGK